MQRNAVCDFFYALSFVDSKIETLKSTRHCMLFDNHPDEGFFEAFREWFVFVFGIDFPVVTLQCVQQARYHEPLLVAR